MKKSKNSINVEGGFLFCEGWNFSKSVSVGSTFIREMRVRKLSPNEKDCIFGGHLFSFSAIRILLCDSNLIFTG